MTRRRCSSMGRRMTTQNNTSTSNTKKPKRAFVPRRYGLSLLTLLGGYLLMIVLGLGLSIALAYQPQGILTFLIFTTLFFGLIALGITVFSQPAYIPKFPVKPIFVSLAIMIGGILLLTIYITIRQPDDESQLRVMMIAMVLSVIGTMIGFGLKAWFEKHPQKFNGDLLAMVIAVTGTLLSALLVPGLLHIDDPTIAMRLSILLLMLGFVLFFALIVLNVINTPDTKSETIPDGHAGMVRVKGRIERITFDKSMELKKGEVFDKVDMRLRSSTVTAKDCMTADHVPTDVRASIEWKLIATEDDVRAFHTKSDDPEGAIKTLAEYAIVNEIGQRVSLYIAGREDQIAAGVQRRLTGAAKQYGISVKGVAITHALLKYPTPAQSMSPLTEVSRLNVMDPAVRMAAEKTVKHAEAVMSAEAAALSGKEEKGKDEGNDQPHSH